MKPKASVKMRWLIWRQRFRAKPKPKSKSGSTTSPHPLPRPTKAEATSWDVNVARKSLLQVAPDLSADGRATIYALRIGALLQCLQFSDWEFHGGDHPKSPVPTCVARARPIIEVAMLRSVHPRTLVRTPPYLGYYHRQFLALTSSQVSAGTRRADDTLWTAIAALASDQTSAVKIRLAWLAQNNI